MRKTACLLIGGVSLLMADPAVHAIGAGARPYGMANNHTALAADFSALFWNPAGMAFIPAREVHLSLDLIRQEAATACGDTSRSSRVERFGLSSAGLLRSLPTKRGGFAFALGFLSPYLLDDLNDSRGADIFRGDSLSGFAGTLVKGDTLFRDAGEHVSRGRISLWSAGMGWQIAKGLGFGFSAGLLIGSENREYRLRSHTAQGLFESVDVSVERAYLGYDARAGLLYAPAKYVSVGCRLEAPRLAKMAEDYTERNYLIPNSSCAETVFGVLKSSFAGAVGAAVRLPFVTIASDATFRAPLPGAAAGSDEAYWKEGIGAGLELPVRFAGGVLRGGYSYSQFDLTPARIEWDEEEPAAGGRIIGAGGRHQWAAGGSFFAGSAVSIEFAYGYMRWKFSSTDQAWQNDIIERHVSHRGMLSVAARY